MTGQILAGASPPEAVKDQVVLMFLIASGTTLGTVSVDLASDRRRFKADDRGPRHGVARPSRKSGRRFAREKAASILKRREVRRLSLRGRRSPSIEHRVRMVRAGRSPDRAGRATRGGRGDDATGHHSRQTIMVREMTQMSNRKRREHHRDGHPGSQEAEDRAYWRRAHKDWRLWVVVALMLLAMFTYVMSMDESVLPGGRTQAPVPAAPGL